MYAGFRCRFASCSDDDDEKGPDDTGSQLTLPQSRMFILNEGGYGSNNAGIAFMPLMVMQTSSMIFSSCKTLHN